VAVYKNKKSPFWQIKFQHRGVKVEKSSKSTIKSEALRQERDLKKEIDNDHFYPKKPQISLEGACKKFLDVYKPPRWTKVYHKQASGVRDRLIGQLDKPVRCVGDRDVPITALAVGNVSEITTTKLDEHYSNRINQGYQPSTIHDEFQLLKRILRRARVDGNDCPALDTLEWPTINKGKGRERILTDQEIRDIRNNITDLRHRDFFDCLHMTGCRHMDIAKLAFQNVNFDENVITIYHYKSKQAIPYFMPKPVRAIIFRRHADPNRHPKWIFPNKKKLITATLICIGGTEQ